MKVGMDHNEGLTDDQDVAKYILRDVAKRAKGETTPYKISRNEIVGRHMVAARDIKPGEVVFVEAPLTFGPSDITKPVCLGCYISVTASSPSCSKCGFPMCSQECPRISDHVSNECGLFAQNQFKVDSRTFNYDKPEPYYSIISPLRALLIKEKDPQLWQLIWMQMSHDGQRKKSEYWQAKTKKGLDMVNKAVKLSEEEMATLEIILGILLVNDFEISLRDRTKEESGDVPSSIRGLFGLASMPSHSCVANCKHDFSTCKDGFVMTVRAVTAISKGQEITHSYTEPMDTVVVRQTLVKLGKFFQCQCPRCIDSTELGTFSSALKCPKCTKGTVTSSNTQDMEADWQCDQCRANIKCSQVQAVTGAVKEAADRLEVDPKVPSFEEFLEKYSQVLHPNHVIIVDKKYTLAKMYGRMEGYQADQMTDDQFKRKRQLCQEVLAVLDKIMPGRSRKRGMMMYELHLPLVMLTNRNLQRGPGCGVSPDILKSDLKDGLKYLKQSLEILGDEPEGSFESKIVQGSSESIGQLDDWVKTVCNSI